LEEGELSEPRRDTKVSQTLFFKFVLKNAPVEVDLPNFLKFDLFGQFEKKQEKQNSPQAATKVAKDYGKNKMH